MTLLAVYIICILDYGNDVRQRAYLSDFLFKFKTGHKAAATTHNINNASGPGIANEPTLVQWWFKKFCKGDKSLGNEECWQNGQPSEVDNNQLRESLKLIFLQLYGK